MYLMSDDCASDLRSRHGPATLAQFLQLAGPPLVAPAPRGDAALKPVKLLRQLGVEPLRVSRLFLIDLFRPCLETAETHLRPPDAAALQPQGRTRQPGQEIGRASCRERVCQYV